MRGVNAATHSGETPPARREGIRDMGDPVKRIERRSRRAIFQAYLDNARREKADKVAVTDGDGRKLTFTEITRGAFALGGALARKTGKDERVGVLLPTGAGACRRC